MKKGFFTLGFLTGLLCASILFSVLKPGRSGEGLTTRQFKVAHGLPTSHPVHTGIEHFAERVHFHSGGRLQFKVFPNGQLGSETQNLEQMQAGTLDAAKVGASTLGSFIPVSKVFSLPYLFQSSDHYWSILNGEIGTELLEALATNGRGQPSGFRGLAYYDAGSRNFYAPKAILSPDDLVGMKIRVMNDPVAIDMMKALGASPTPIAWGELYTALQQGVVDGAENNPPSFVSSNHFEVCQEFSFDEHSRIPDVLMISDSTWKNLSAEEQNWIHQAAADSSKFQRNAWDEDVASAVEVMKSKGVTIHQVDPKPFMEATQSVRERYAEGEIGTFLNRIQAEIEP